MILAGTSSRQVSHRLVVWLRNRYGATLRCALGSCVGAVVDPSIDHQSQAEAVEQVKRPDQRRIGLEELPDEALGAVPGAHDIEAAPHGPGLAPLKADQVGG